VSPTMCVERKSLPDLVQSLKSGRLYTQAEAMCIHYSIPILLIEFDRGKSFSLSISRDEPGLDTASRLILLCIHFPKLRIIWSPSPNFSAEIFEELKVLFAYISKMPVIA
jgi:DNA excision repair protein ERCC-4